MWVSIPNRLLWADQNTEAMYAWLLTTCRKLWGDHEQCGDGRNGNGTAKQVGVLGGCLRGQLPKKDAESGETSTGSCKRAMSRRIPNGATRERGIVRIAG